jgi:hypothetical protein
MPPPACPSPRESGAFARARDERVCRLLAAHPVTAAMLVRVGWFPTPGKASKRLRRLCARKRVRLVGTVSRAPGRPEHVYAAFRPKADALAHEVELTEVCLRLDAGAVRRGADADPRLRPDAEVFIRGRRYLLELDRGSMSYGQVARRFRVYEGTRDFVLWVCPTPARREGLRARAAGIRGVALFTTRAEVLESPHGPIWRDYAGGTVALPREGAGRGA